MMGFVKNVGKLRRKNKVINLDELSTLLVWAVENLGQLNELVATDKGVYFRLMDGRAGLLMMGLDGVPMAALPSEVMTA